MIREKRPLVSGARRDKERGRRSVVGGRIPIAIGTEVRVKNPQSATDRRELTEGNPQSAIQFTTSPLRPLNLFLASTVYKLPGCFISNS